MVGGIQSEAVQTKNQRAHTLHVCEANDVDVPR